MKLPIHSKPAQALLSRQEKSLLTASIIDNEKQAQVSKLQRRIKPFAQKSSQLVEEIQNKKTPEEQPKDEILKSAEEFLRELKSKGLLEEGK